MENNGLFMWAIMLPVLVCFIAGLIALYVWTIKQFTKRK